jgi:hypothetical protein
VFFLGLLSTPLPYLLLAAFYFVGFAMGMFNNSTGDEALDTISSVTIPAEVRENAIDHSNYYYQINSAHIHIQADIDTLKEITSTFFPDTGIRRFHYTNTQVHEFLFSGFQFSRPPPAIC